MLHIFCLKIICSYELCIHRRQISWMNFGNSISCSRSSQLLVVHNYISGLFWSTLYTCMGTCGSWCISGSIWGLRKGNRQTLSPCLRWYSCPLAMCSVLSCTTSLEIITAAVSRRVSLRTLSAEQGGQESGWSPRGILTSEISSVLLGTESVQTFVQVNEESDHYFPLNRKVKLLLSLTLFQCSNPMIFNKSNEPLSPSQRRG